MNHIEISCPSCKNFVPFVVSASKKAYLILVILSFFSFQNDTKPQIIKKPHDYFTVDNLGNMFFIKENEMVKHLANGNYFNRYSNLKLGNITSVDATNALRIMLFYKDYQQLVFVDNQLTQKNDPVSLEKIGHEQTELACVSANNGIWLFNKANNELVRFDEQLKQIASTGNLKQMLQTEEVKPNFLMEHNGNVFLNCPDFGIYVFDIFGTFSKVISLKGLKNFQVNENIIYFQKDNGICSYNYKLFDEVCKPFPINKLSQAVFLKNKAYLSNNDSLFVY
ncbi:MAG: hypothetical protein KBG47_05620 [Bacteroidia bacterium]|nr:hypothetical protein [Bacteroidia bacterium]